MNLVQLMGQYMGFMKDPRGYLLKNNLNIPEQYLNNPQDAIQYLMNTGRVNQQMYNDAINQARQLNNFSK